jgi:chromosome segregation ATPase
MAEDTSERLMRVQAELSSVLEERLGVLSEALAASERTTRRIIAAEVELERNLQAREALNEEVGGLESQVRDARSRCDETRRRHGQLTTECDALKRKEMDLDQGMEQGRSEVADARSRVEDLEKEADELRNENTALRSKVTTLEENLTRMRQLKDELMSSISGLTQQMSGIAGGNPE